MSQIKTVLLCAAGVALVAGCNGSLLESKKIDYKSAAKQQMPKLELPPDLTAPGRDERYTVPDSASKGSATFSAYNGERTGAAASANTDVLPKIDKMRIERSGSQRWLVISGTAPDKLWPNIKEFWQENGFIVNIEQPAAGVMETDWAENRAKIGQDFVRNLFGKMLDSLYSTAERDKFRTRLEPGSEAGSTEIYISHRGMYEVYTNEGKSDTRWQPREADPELEAEMLRRLMVRLGVEEVKAKSMMAAQPKEERAKMERASDGTGTLTLQEPFDRAWRRVGLALDRVGFTVEDRDRAQGFYFVRYVDPEADNTKKKDEGYLSKLAFWKSSDNINKNAQYRIYVKLAGPDTSIQVMTREGGVEKSETARKILNLLYEQLK